MAEQKNLVSNAFQTFMKESPNHAKAWGEAIQGLGAASALDKKTQELAYISVLSALNRLSGIPFHVKSAKNAGASRDEVISAILVGLPAAGHVVTQALPVGIVAFDED